MSKTKNFEQIDMFRQPETPKTESSQAVKTASKPPFIPVQTMALDDRDIKNNFMYMIRILLNSHQKLLSTPKGKSDYIDVLIQEMKIKKGLIDPTVAVRSGALRSLKKN